MSGMFSSIAAVLAANPALMAMLALAGIGSFVFGVLAFVMRKSRVSLRPIAFVAGFFAIVLLPQAVGHLALAVRPGTQAAAGGTEPVPSLPAGGRTQDWTPVYAARMPGLQSASIMDWPTGQTLGDLRFGSVADAAAGLITYLSMHSVAPTLDRGGNEVRGARRLGGGVVHLLRDGSTLRVATALDNAQLDALLRAAATRTSGTEPARVAEPQPLVPALQPAVAWMREHVAAQVAAVLLLVAAAVAWFFRAGTWAASVPARPGVPALTADALRARLLALASADNDATMTVQPRADGRVAIGWTLTDARWIDLAAHANRRRRVHRLLLRLDAPARTVWVTEQWSEFDARAGAGGAGLRWHSAIGMTFFERSVHIEPGIVLGPDGRPTGKLLHREVIDLQAIKAPCLATVTNAGWHWRPVMVDWAALFGRGGAETATA